MDANITLPIDIILKLHNAISEEHPVRLELQETIKNYKKSNKKGHVCEGVYMSENGIMKFSEELYLEAAYRGKIDTYKRNAEEDIAKLKLQLERLQSVGGTYLEYETQLTPLLLESRVGVGEPINNDQQALLDKISPLLLGESKAD